MAICTKAIGPFLHLLFCKDKNRARDLRKEIRMHIDNDNCENCSSFISNFFKELDRARKSLLKEDTQKDPR